MDTGHSPGLGREQVQVYGTVPAHRHHVLSEYLTSISPQRHLRDAPDHASPLRAVLTWLRDRVPWADKGFHELRDDWRRPDFFPAHSFVLPHCGRSDSIDPSRDWFPARGLFISAKGARTRLHADPWSSDALLCQVYGEKDFVMYDPEQAPYLTKGGRSVDVEAPDLQTFPDFPRSRETVRDTLRPGEILLVPAGWHHHFKSTSDSISVTWNFVHLCRQSDFLSYLAMDPPEPELKQLVYAYFESPGRRPLAAVLAYSRVPGCHGLAGWHPRPRGPFKKAHHWGFLLARLPGPWCEQQCVPARRRGLRRPTRSARLASTQNPQRNVLRGDKSHWAASH